LLQHETFNRIIIAKIDQLENVLLLDYLRMAQSNQFLVSNC